MDHLLLIREELVTKIDSTRNKPLSRVYVYSITLSLSFMSDGCAFGFEERAVAFVERPQQPSRVARIAIRKVSISQILWVLNFESIVVL